MVHCVVEFGNHDDDFGPAGGILNLQFHVEAVHGGAQHQFDLRFINIGRGANRDTQEKLVRLAVEKLVGFNDIGVARRQGRCHRCHNAGAVVTGNTQDI